MKVVELHPKLGADDIVIGLRKIADEIEAGQYRMQPNMCAVVLGCETTRRDMDGHRVFHDWQTHGLGERCASIFATRGLLLSAASAFDGPGEES